MPRGPGGSPRSRRDPELPWVREGKGRVALPPRAAKQALGGRGDTQPSHEGEGGPGSSPPLLDLLATHFALCFYGKLFQYLLFFV